jgi:NDP-4-keto-2,6-dideoxyhexose 3-C-methyltransferase
MLYQELSGCRICGNKNLVTVVHLGNQALTGVFPLPNETVEEGPLEMVKCYSENGEDVCGLVQLRHDYEMEKLYGENYGYRSGLNKSMIEHLQGIVTRIESRMRLQDDDLVIDIASNDGTLLSSYKNTKLDLLGIDPTSDKFSEYYPTYIDHVPSFFTAEAVQKARGDKKARVVTSIAMFYDLPAPLEIMHDIESVLTDDGIWVVEQSYMPAMIDNTSYDTICHEHLEYYALKQFVWMAERVGLKIVDLEFNDTNGASFAITFAKKDSVHQGIDEEVSRVLKEEHDRGFDDLAIYESFRQHTEEHKVALKDFFAKAAAEGKKIFGYGASTKGNVILQYCGITKNDMPYIAEVNEYKFGRLTPGTLIPIIADGEAKAMKPDYFMVLPWHFKKGIIARETEFLEDGGHLVFPLPKIEVV